MSTSVSAPDGIDEHAPVITRKSLLVEASAEQLWRIHADIAAWPQWQGDIASAEMKGPFEAGGSFAWTTKGIDVPINSTIFAIEQGRRTLWGGPAMGIEGIHEWRFEPRDGATLVSTEESWSGEAVDPETMQAALDESLDRWLDFMRNRAVSRSAA